jgi:hypothetical protein
MSIFGLPDRSRRKLKGQFKNSNQTIRIPVEKKFHKNSDRVNFPTFFFI